MKKVNVVVISLSLKRQSCNKIAFGPKQRANAFLEILPIKNNRINISYQFTSKKKMMRTMIAVILGTKMWN